MNAKPLLLVVLSICTLGTAHAQWQWVDSSGRKVFSDRPPPPNAPVQQVRGKSPGTPASAPASSHSAALAPASSGAAPAPSAAAAAPQEPPPPSGVDAELDKRKTEQEAQEAQRKQAEEQKVALQRKENCDRAQRSRAVMQSGQMISHTNAKGERGFMNDATRQQEITRANQVIASDCR